jgi:hypothetical protein
MGEADQVTVTTTGKSAFKCDACDKTLDCSSPSKPPESLSYEVDMSRASASPVSSVNTQLEAVPLNGQCTMQLIQSLVDMVRKLTEEVTDLKMIMYP